MPEASPAPARARSQFSLAMRRFAAMGSARFGLAILALFLVGAIYAPFLGGEVAIVWIDAEGWSFPVLGDLFNRRSYPSPHDLLFNLLILLLPPLVVGWWAARRFLAWSGVRCTVVALLVVAVAWVGCRIPLLPQEGPWQAIWDDRPTAGERYQVYRGLDEQARGEVSALFPLIPHGYASSFYSLEDPFETNPDTDHSFLMGTDDRGYDVLVRMLFGARISLTIGLVAVGLSMAIGIVIGAVSAYFGGKVDLVLQRIVEVVMTLPGFIILLLVVAMVGRDIYTIMVVLGLLGWPGTARLVRGEFLRELGRDYVMAGAALGLPRWRIMFLHILPDTLTPLFVSANFAFAVMILVESSLVFIGLGDPNAPSWGALLDVGRRNIGYPWLIWIPGLTIFLLVSALNLIGNAMREALDPKGTT